MNRKKVVFSTFVISLLLALAAIGGSWGPTLAQTVPTARPSRTPTSPSNPGPGEHPTSTPINNPNPGNPDPVTPPPGALSTAAPSPENGIYTSTGIIKDGAGQVALSYLKSAWGGAVFSECRRPSSALAILSLLQVETSPRQEQMNFSRQIVEVSLFTNFRFTSGEVCKYEVTFDLSGYERYLYNNYSGKFGPYWYNPQQDQWEACPSTRLEESQGQFGQLICETTQTGRFSLGTRTKASE